MSKRKLDHLIGNTEKWTATHHAANNGNIDNLDADDVNTRDALGRTPLHIAAIRTHTSKDGYDVAEMLIAMGADSTLQNNAKETPAEIAKDPEKFSKVIEDGRKEIEKLSKKYTTAATMAVSNASSAGTIQPAKKREIV